MPCIKKKKFLEIYFCCIIFLNINSDNDKRRKPNPNFYFLLQLRRLKLNPCWQLTLFDSFVENWAISFHFFSVMTVSLHKNIIFFSSKLRHKHTYTPWLQWLPADTTISQVWLESWRVKTTRPQSGGETEWCEWVWSDFTKPVTTNFHPSLDSLPIHKPQLENSHLNAS